MPARTGIPARPPHPRHHHHATARRQLKAPRLAASVRSSGRPRVANPTDRATALSGSNLLRDVVRVDEHRHRSNLVLSARVPKGVVMTGSGFLPAQMGD